MESGTGEDSNWWDDIFGGISDLLGSIGEKIAGVAQGITDGFKALIDFFTGFFDGLLDFVKKIFIPGDDYFSDKVSSLQGSLNEKIDLSAYSDAMNGLTSGQAIAVKTPRTSFMGTSFDLDVFGFINEYKGLVQWIIRAVAFYNLLQYNINNVYKLIRGGSLDEGGEE